MQIDCDFDSGNIDVVSADDPSRVALEIRMDAGGEHSQWFHFRVRGAAGQDCCFCLTNASKTSYPAPKPRRRPPNPNPFTLLILSPPSG